MIGMICAVALQFAAIVPEHARRAQDEMGRYQPIGQAIEDAINANDGEIELTQFPRRLLVLLRRTVGRRDDLQIVNLRFDMDTVDVTIARRPRDG